MIVQTLENRVIQRTSINFQTNSAFININTKSSLISLSWDSHTDPDEFKRAYELAVSLVKRFRIRNWLNDARNLAYLNIESQNWICRHIVPQLLQAKVKKIARVVLDEPLAILVSYNIMDKINDSQQGTSQMACEVFTDRDNAISWLTS